MQPLHKTWLGSTLLAVVAGASIVAANGAAAADEHRSAQPTASAAPLAASFASIQEQLSQVGSVAFRDLLEDASDETIQYESNVTTQVTDLAVDPAQCRLTYRQKFRRDDDVSDQAHQVDLRDVETIRTEPFEKYENEFTGKPGYVYVLTTPAITTVELIHPDHKADWFAFIDQAAARQLADRLTEARKLCRQKP